MHIKLQMYLFLYDAWRMILMGTNSLRGPLDRVGPENLDFKTNSQFLGFNPESEFLNFSGAQESISGNQFRQPM
jgi:hypothetical protein